ncbi:hypothetical protein Tco_0518553, partial [Tanacetum coccineum]
NSKKGYTPMMEKLDYRKSQGVKTPTEVQSMQRVPYDLAIGSIMYAVRCARPDVAFAQNPSEIHWTPVKTILKYLRNTKDMVLVTPPNWVAVEYGSESVTSQINSTRYT